MKKTQYRGPKRTLCKVMFESFFAFMGVTVVEFVLWMFWCPWFCGDFGGISLMWLVVGWAWVTSTQCLAEHLGQLWRSGSLVCHTMSSLCKIATVSQADVVATIGFETFLVGLVVTTSGMKNLLFVDGILYTQILENCCSWISHYFSLWPVMPTIICPSWHDFPMSYMYESVWMP